VLFDELLFVVECGDEKRDRLPRGGRSDRGSRGGDKCIT